MQENLNSGISKRVLREQDLREGLLVQRFCCAQYVYETGRSDDGSWLFRAVKHIEGRAGSGPGDSRRNLEVLPYGNGDWIRCAGPWCETFYTCR